MEKKVICSNDDCRYHSPNFDKPLGRCIKDCVVLIHTHNNFPTNEPLLKCESYRKKR